MPKITGASIEEHRASQHRALLDAAEELINSSGGTLPTLAEVGEAIGLARSSVYLYVKSRKDLIVQLLLDIIPKWIEQINSGIDAAGDDNVDRLLAYVNETVDLFAEGTHGPLMIAAQHVPEAFQDPRVREAHDALAPIARNLLVEAGCQHPAAALPIIDSAIQRGADLISSGRADRDTVHTVLHAMVRGAVNS
ncbi:MAG: TetR/AcrR family transcriptional regulator [Corynebacterium camporealensis]|uniref:TetR/AcrR family transcriptional regulator n=1 Tax=Corynebacterium camporealensis TaxID=161896 RepID=UPI002A913A23|nr:TetR/AcrR family transcriptional regulator [Corynebacterium camporealensis]MDY5840476.1 TetR/AcrR family transcriptional regulator [Corynebacterium camporealensis]